MIAQTSSADKQELVLLSPGMPVIEPVIDHCLVVQYQVYFDTPSASLSLMGEASNRDMEVWKLPGPVYKRNKTAYVQLPSAVRRVSVVARIQKSDWFSMRSMEVQQGNCSDLYDTTDPGKIQT